MSEKPFAGKILEFSLPLLLQGAARQHSAIDGFDAGCLDCRDIDPSLSYYNYMVGSFGRADPD